jgi:diaminohydroxyphosphoribosylaminopyrimidine deaminase/5-amino-6-(5-phosphoribosylamino)uracil reductase
MTDHETYMQRCIELAKLGEGNVSPNPMVGAVLVHENRIIGEGYHQQYGFAHAEVNCISSIKEEDVHLLPQSTIYVSLEPCAHFGKTPPCADLIIHKKIPRVAVGCRDPFEPVNGKGIEKLKAAGTEVTVNVCEDECKELNKRFFTFHTKQRPYIILKWAQTADGKIASAGTERLLISNEFTDRKVHKWRSEEAAILVGTNTALLDNPRLGNRLWNGKSPIRIVLDKELRLPTSLHLFDRTIRTIVLNHLQHTEEANLLFYQLTEKENAASAICEACRELNIQSVLIEGGSQLLQTFIDCTLWDEARIITNQALYTGEGLQAPTLQQHQLTATEQFFSDRIDYFIHTQP